MEMQQRPNVEYILHADTNCFSQIVIDYLQNKQHLQELYNLYPSIQNIETAIANKQAQPINRAQLVAGLQQQYAGITITDVVEKNIVALVNANTFTICTAHQPNVFTGPLYYIYKILHTVVLANYLAEKYPNYNFVPVYYMGAEDADVAEIGTIHINQHTYQWQPNEAGAVGRMSTNTLVSIFNEIEKYIDVNTPNGKQLHTILSDAYNQQLPLADATIRLVNSLFGQYGVVVLQPDAPMFKSLFVNAMQDELLHQSSDAIVQLSNEKIAKHYKPQAHSRPINLFYLQNGSRERIEKVGEMYTVHNTDLQFTQTEILAQLHANPQQFSPNVILRGVFQETILPNIAFIGGGGELAYWLQLKDVFAHHHIVYPMLVLRQSFSIINNKTHIMQQQLQLSNADLFLPLHEAQKQWINKYIQLNNFDAQTQQHKHLFTEYEKHVAHLPPQFSKTIAAHLAKSNRIQHRLQTKLIGAYKKNEAVHMQKLEQLHHQIFPSNTLQERHQNMIPFYLQYGQGFFDAILQATKPFGDEFGIVKWCETV
jgi:bacillithiol synthase